MNVAEACRNEIPNCIRPVVDRAHPELFFIVVYVRDKNTQEGVENIFRSFFPQSSRCVYDIDGVGC